jgi:rhodanese-related sulfurtransferase
MFNMDLPNMETVYIAFGLFILVTAYNYIRPKEERKYTSLDTDEVMDFIKNNSNSIIIDVRGKEEYKSEHIKGAKNIPLDDIEKKIGSFPRNRPIIIYCKRGAKSIRAIRKLEVAGFDQLYHMHEGLRGWKINDYPTVKRQ